METEFEFEEFDKILGDELEPQLGQCCACGGTENVRNIVMHDFRAPIAGAGWGCIVCHLPLDGALSVLCDHCRDTHAPVLEICCGYPKLNVRIPIHLFVKTLFAHDRNLHADDFVPSPPNPERYSPCQS